MFVSRIVAAAACFMSAFAGPAAAQDGFGRMVAVARGTVIVAKPGSAKGPASLYQFARSPDGGERWTLVGTLRAPGSLESGRSLSPSLQLAGDWLAVGAADPAVAQGAHLFRRTAGAWVYDTTTTVDATTTVPPASAATPSDGGADPSVMDFAGILRILQPPRRTVALDGSLLAVSVAAVAGAGGPSEVRLFERSDGGLWTPENSLASPSGGSETGFGSALLWADERLLVSAPLLDGSGAVHVFSRSEATGSWSLEHTLRPEAPDPEGRFGAALARDGDYLLVGAPGAGAGVGQVFAYRHADGSWRSDQVLEPTEPDEAQAFGAALAVFGKELWVGAPWAGRVYRFLHQGDAWQAVPAPELPQEFDEPDLSGGSAELGASIALGADIAVVGAPAADGGAGGAVVFRRSPESAWLPGELLRPHDDLAAVTAGEVRCEDGTAAGFSCEGVDLLAFLPVSALGGSAGERVSDVWGWTDPETGREYALAGRTGGAALVDVTDPASPRYRGVVAANPSGARDLKVYSDHLFFTGDGAGNHGLVIFDLTRLRGESPESGIFEPDTVYRGIASAHNLVMDPESGFAFPVGASGGGETCGGGLHMLNVREPKSPVFAGCFTDTEGLIYPGRTHDAQCVVYGGPDARFQGRQICFVSNETALRIVDVTDKSQPVPVGTATYPGLAYVHQGWLTDDHRYYYLDDELDELTGTTQRTRTYIFDIAELGDPLLVGSVEGPDGATDHNLYIKGDRMYQANYQAGFRLFDITDREAPREIGWFDTTPYEGSPPGFVGAWTAYPFFDSGTVVVTSMYEGLFLLRPRPRLIP